MQLRFRTIGGASYLRLAITVLGALLIAYPLYAQNPPAGAPAQSDEGSRALASRPADQRETIQADLSASLHPLTQPISIANVDETSGETANPSQLQADTLESRIESPFPAVDDDTTEDYFAEGRSSAIAEVTGVPSYFVGYEKGLVVRSAASDKTPFELKIRAQNQIRFTGFAPDVDTWTNGAGVVSPVTDASNFQIPRGRIIFSGYAFRPELTYNLNIDYNTVSSNQINFRAYWLAWRFGRAMTVYAGQSKVPGSREWLMSVMNVLGPDRSMATTFFRPSLSQGIWITGEPADGLFYHAMMSNGFNTLGSTSQQLSSVMTFSGSLWWEPWGAFGPSYSDFEWHCEPAVRIGTSLTYAPERGPQGSPDAPENADVRLSNGTLLTETGALAPGTTLNLYKIGLTSFDLAYKHCGFGLSGEFYLQDIFGLGANAPLPQASIFQYGGFAQAGYFVMKEKLELYARTSHVASSFGTGSEYAGGFNWFFLPAKQNLRFTFDAAWLNHNPADQNRTNLQAGQTGLLIRSQLQFFF